METQQIHVGVGLCEKLSAKHTGKNAMAQVPPEPCAFVLILNHQN
jgi:hypothetical protein